MASTISYGRLGSVTFEDGRRDFDLHTPVIYGASWSSALVSNASHESPVVET